MALEIQEQETHRLPVAAASRTDSTCPHLGSYRRIQTQRTWRLQCNEHVVCHDSAAAFLEQLVRLSKLDSQQAVCQPEDRSLNITCPCKPSPFTCPCNYRD